ncbi:HlyD family type I secretion periplasmic adaptor subunit, partial [Vibrio owensii]
MSNQLPTDNKLTAESVFRFMPTVELKLKGPILLGVLTLSLFLGGLGYWAATSKLESAAISY